MNTRNILFHDGCNACLSMARRFSMSLDGLEVVDLSISPERVPDAWGAGVKLLPSLVLGGDVYAITPHSKI